MWIFAFLAIVLGLFLCAVFGIPIYAVVLVGVIVIIAFVALLLLLSTLQNENADRVVRAKLIEEIAVYKEELDNTGFSVGWKGQAYSNFEYQKVFDHYECVFSVLYNDGKTGTIRCIKGDEIYNKLIWKAE